EVTEKNWWTKSLNTPKKMTTNSRPVVGLPKRSYNLTTHEKSQPEENFHKNLGAFHSHPRLQYCHAHFSAIHGESFYLQRRKKSPRNPTRQKPELHHHRIGTQCRRRLHYQ